jgi:hypothetical protein
MKVGKGHPLLGEGIKVRCFDLASGAADIGPAHVIGHDQQSAWSLCFCIRRQDDQEA